MTKVKKYDHQQIEKKWQKRWAEEKLYRTADKEKAPKYYILDMFPYPSGSGLHVGHPKGYIATDVVARKKMMEGFNVLHPMGWDAFGLPAENYALKNKEHPRISTEKNVKIFKKQLEILGFCYDWEREINTTDPSFYKWTQWTFLKFFNSYYKRTQSGERGMARPIEELIEELYGTKDYYSLTSEQKKVIDAQRLAFEDVAPINWCPSCKTGLANEDLEDGKCERCGSAVELKPMRQWMLGITKYADRMLEDLELLPEWESFIKTMQTNWIGKSIGAQVNFGVRSTNSAISLASHRQTAQKVPSVLPASSPCETQKSSELATFIHDELKNDLEVQVFTTRPDTLFGCTYTVVAPEHELINLIKNKKLKIENYDEVINYVKKVGQKSELERTSLNKEKTGVEIKGAKAINPVNGEEVPIFVADYVLGNYGTGAIMAVPAHDERDFEFAVKYSLPIVPVVAPEIEWDFTKKAFVEEGVLINSGQFDGLTIEEGKKQITTWLEKEGKGKSQVNYKLRDWVFSRQRYWGEPIPIIHCEKCGAVPVPEKDLPLKLPEVKDYEPSGTGESPLATMPEWVNVKCPHCGGDAKRETNTMPQWAGSSWYYLRFIDPHNDKALVDSTKEKKFMPVDFYVGGAEHATRHLIYARFWHKFLYDLDVVSTVEPFTKLKHVGLILAEDGRKMSKRWNNVINPDDIVERFGADSMRLYEMFMAPFSQASSWNTQGVVGVRKFVEKLWRLQEKLVDSEPQNASYRTLLHQTIRKIGEDIDNFKLNTAVSAMMILVNKMTEMPEINKDDFGKLIQILAPFAPHVSEEIWQGTLGKKTSVFKENWPEFDAELAKEEEVTIAVQVNGKVRTEFVVNAGLIEHEDQIVSVATNLEKIQTLIDNKEIKKTIYVPGKIVNIVVS